jgi:hypothetical protein
MDDQSTANIARRIQIDPALREALKATGRALERLTPRLPLKEANREPKANPE